jgi:hypothetical protein
MRVVALPLLAALAGATGPCDILAAAGTPCFAAHSTVRALFAKYDGPLYTVKSNHTGKSSNISVIQPGGFANVKEHEAICPNVGDCVIEYIIDQAGNGNHLSQRDDTGIPGGTHSWDHGRRHMMVDASRHKIYVGSGSTPVYGMWFDPDDGYNNNNTKNVATGNEPETIYAVLTGTRSGTGCCFDYGNSEITDRDDGDGTMEAIYFGNGRWNNNVGYQEEGCVTKGNNMLCEWPEDNCCGPWVGADLEQGMYYGGGDVTQQNPQSKPLRHDFVSLMLKGRTDGFTLKGGDASSGKFSTMYDGSRPDPKLSKDSTPGYQPMRKEGAIILGTGGDQSNNAQGNFYEGFMATGATTDATDDAVQANIVAVGYKMAKSEIIVF